MSYLIESEQSLSNILCPKCDTPLGVEDGFESFISDGDEKEMECPKCGALINVYVSFSTDYDIVDEGN